MRSTVGTSINTNRLACTWKVAMERGDNIKEEGGYEIGDQKIKEEIL